MSIYGRWVGVAAMLAAVGTLVGAPSGEAKLGAAYVRWDARQLTLGNAQFEARWDNAADGMGLGAFSGPDGKAWVKAASSKAPAAIPAIDVTASTGRAHQPEAESLLVQVTVQTSPVRHYAFQLFPDSAAVLVTQLEPPAAATAEPAAESGGLAIPPAGSRPKPPPAPRPTVTGLRLYPEHLRLTQVTLVDQTDEHDELVSTREWLLDNKEKPFAVAGNLLVIDDVLARAGVVMLKLAPLPHARPDRTESDFRIDPRQKHVQPVPDRYPMALLAYTGGEAGRIEALQRLQRQLRVYRAGRDGRFVSNTWGDRSRDARINEEFIRKEIAAGARLGVDVIQIDDGWQKGRSINSANPRGGVWNGYWAADPAFWDPDPKRFPHGLAPLTADARQRGMGFGLWFAPDSSDSAANWQRDADRIIALHRECGISYVKVDSIKTPTPAAVVNQRRLFDRVLDATGADVVFDLDVTAETRPGYFGLPDIGPLFVENRYTDYRSYWPHHTLRNLWQLAHFVDPMRLRIEFLNAERNVATYGDDPLAPARYRPDTLFATTMMACPLGWFETSNLSEKFVAAVAPLVASWKSERDRMQAGTIRPVGDAPDGIAWTGFLTRDQNGIGGYALVFRELNDRETFAVPLAGVGSGAARVTVLGGRGEAVAKDGVLNVRVPEKLDFLWVRVAAEGRKN